MAPFAGVLAPFAAKRRLTRTGRLGPGAAATAREVLAEPPARQSATQLPPNVMRLIYAKADPRTQVAMRAANKLVRDTTAAPLPGKYRHGMGKHQRLWDKGGLAARAGVLDDVVWPMERQYRYYDMFPGQWAHLQEYLRDLKMAYLRGFPLEDQEMARHAARADLRLPEPRGSRDERVDDILAAVHKMVKAAERDAGPARIKAALAKRAARRAARRAGR